MIFSLCEIISGSNLKKLSILENLNFDLFLKTPSKFILPSLLSSLEEKLLLTAFDNKFIFNDGLNSKFKGSSLAKISFIDFKFISSDIFSVVQNLEFLLNEHPLIVIKINIIFNKLFTQLSIDFFFCF